MYFYLLHIEESNESAVLIHGKILSDVDDSCMDASTCKSINGRISVENISSPILLKASEDKVSELEEDINRFMNGKNIGYRIEYVEKENVFYNNLDRKIRLMRMIPEKKASFDDFFSDYSEAIITEFINPIEQVIISRRLKGPCIIRIKEYELNGKEIVVRSMDEIDFVCNSRLPEMSFGSLSIRFNRTDILKYCLNVRDKSYCGAVRSSSNEENRRVESMGYVLYPTSNGLLNHLNGLINKEEIDCIIYHNVPSMIVRRLEISGTIRCDLFVFANGNIKGHEFSIEEMACTLNLDIRSELKKEYGVIEGYEEQCKALPVESVAIHQIFQSLDALQLSKEMSEISGYLMNRTFKNLRAERIEYTLLHELYDRGYIFPPVMTRKEMKYSGGLVLTPQSGFYEDIILLLDFNSLYPSIIQEFNVCFSTIGLWNGYGDIDEKQLNIIEERSRGSEKGFLPKIIESFVRRRRSIKELMKTSKCTEEMRMLDIRQKALKLTANSIYGCFGFVGSRFCNYTMAGYITSKGRDLLLEAKRIAEIECNMKVIYGDTDSVMIDTGLPGINQNYSKALEESKRLIERINSRYKNIEIDVDKVFKKLLLYKKKRYAGLCVDSEGMSWIEYKGLDVVKKNFCKVSKRICCNILELLLIDLENHDMYKRLYDDTFHVVWNNGNDKIRSMVEDELMRLMKDIRDIDVSEFVIYNTLSKAPESYNVSPPHVGLALRLKKAGMKFEQGDVVRYVIGRGEEKSIHKRVFHPNEEFEIDYEYYISNQIVPAILRIVCVVKGMHPEKISKIFGICGVPRVETRGEISFLTPCCEVVQEMSSYCKECSKEIPQSFYVSQVVEMIRKEIENLYNVSSRCVECGISYDFHLMTCSGCNSGLSFSADNQGFDLFLSSFRSLKIPEVDEMVRKCMMVSEYRRIDLSRYFSDEIRRGM